MKFTKLTLTNKAGTICALSNICGYWPTAPGVVEVQDAIEDAVDAKDACKRLNNMDLLDKPWTVDRTTEAYVRLKHMDILGNIDYLIISL